MGSSPTAIDPGLRAFAREQRQLMTRAESTLWEALRGGRFHGRKFKRQVPVAPYIVDFLCASARLVIELDGAPHEAAERRLRDAARDRWLTAQGFRVLRFTNDQILGNADLVLDAIRLNLSIAPEASAGAARANGAPPLSRPACAGHPPPQRGEGVARGPDDAE